MGQQDLALQGYPRSHIKNDYTFSYYCGGGGAVGPLYLQAQPFVKYAIDVNPFITLNRDLILYTNTFQVYSDAGGTTPKAWNLALSAVSTLTAAQILAQNITYTNIPLTNIELTMARLPQPTDAGWASKIWVYLYWGDVATYAYTQYIDTVQYLTPVKYDFDVRQ